MNKFDDKLSVIIDNSKNNSFFSNNKNNISFVNKNSHSDIKNNAVINQSFRSLNEKNNKVLNEKISRIEEKMSKIKKNGSFDTILLNFETENNKTTNKDKLASSYMSRNSKIINNIEKVTAITPINGINKAIKYFNKSNTLLQNCVITNPQYVLYLFRTSKHLEFKRDVNSAFHSIKDSNLVLNNLTKNHSSVVPLFSDRNYQNNPITIDHKKTIPIDNRSQKDDKKISVISEKLSQINNNRMNLDSKVNSQNDISKLKESNFLKNNSFFSYNI